MCKDYKIDVTVKNNFLYKAMVENGFYTNADLSRATGLQSTTVGLMMNLKTTLYDRRGKIRPSWLKVSEALSRLPEDLVPKQHHFEALENNKASVEMDLEALGQLIPKTSEEKLIESDLRKHIHKQLNDLPEKRSTILKMYFGIGEYDPMTLDEIANHLGVTRTCVGVNKDKALRMLKHPSRNRELREFV